MLGKLTQLIKSKESGLRTPGKPIEVSFPSEPIVGKRFECCGESLTIGMDARWISTSPVETIISAPEKGEFTFRTESGSSYKLIITKRL